MIRPWALAVCVLLLYPGCSAGPSTPPPGPDPPPTPTYEAIVALFAYDAAASLDIWTTDIEVRDGYEQHTISYASPGGRVPAFLLVPDGPGPFAGMIYLHWGGATPSPSADKTEFLLEAAAMARLKTVCLLIDAPFVRQGSASSGCELYIQTVIDLRRGVDLLRARQDVDGARIGYVGHSFGATWGGVLAGVDRRCKAYVLIAGLPNFIDCDSCNPRCTDRSLNASNVIGHATPSALLFQFSEVDQFVTPTEANAYFRAASEPKTLQWYLCGHDFLSDQALFDRTQWLIAQLGLVSPSSGDANREPPGCPDPSRPQVPKENGGLSPLGRSVPKDSR